MHFGNGRLQQIWSKSLLLVQAYFWKHFLNNIFGLILLFWVILVAWKRQAISKDNKLRTLGFRIINKWAQCILCTYKSLVVGTYAYTFDFYTFKSVIFRSSMKWFFGPFWHFWANFWFLHFQKSHFWKCMSKCPQPM